MHEYFEDVSTAEEYTFGTYAVSREEIVSFAESYDPQPFHLGETEDSMFDGVVASGWHTAAMTMRLLVDNYLAESGALGAAGLDELRWPAPVQPGDELSVRLTFADPEPWDENRGLVHQLIETTTQDGEPVLWLDARVLYRRR